jgi:hypothetical protein
MTRPTDDQIRRLIEAYKSGQRTAYHYKPDINTLILWAGNKLDIHAAVVAPVKVADGTIGNIKKVIAGCNTK